MSKQKPRCVAYDMTLGSLVCWYFLDKVSGRVYRLFEDDVKFTKTWADMEDVPFVGY